MNSIKIQQLLKKRCGQTFLGVFPIDRLPQRLPPRRPLLLVCNTDPHDKPGNHWIALYIAHNGEFFDSFGEPPQKTFELYLEKHCNSFTVNNKVLQSILSAFCGHYAIFYCLMKMLNYDLNEIIACFGTDTALNDYIVHQFVCVGLAH